METFLFGPDATLFGAYWEGDPRPNAPAVLICNGYGQDAVRSNLVLRHTARLFSESGCPTLLFDYHGAGDSADPIGPVDLDSMEADTALAKQELLEISGRDRVVILGLRIGAWLAARHADQVILWSPVIDGSAHVEALQELRQAMLSDSQRFPIPRREEATNGASRQLLGFTYGNQYLQQLTALTLSAMVGQKSFRNIALLQHESAVDEQITAAMGSNAPTRLDRPDEHWDSLPALEIALTPSPALQSLAETVARW